MYHALMPDADYNETKPVMGIKDTNYANGELLDPKLVQDQTILILELRGISGKITRNNDKRIYVKEDEEPILI